jgi:hypothetical protein
MKIIANKSFILIIYLLGFVNIFAAPDPPMPNGKNQGPPPPPGLPIDENLSSLLIIALLFGIYIIYNHTYSPKKKS